MLAAVCLTAAFAFIATASAYARDPKLLKNKPENLVQSLRKKLMKDNYDYITVNNEDTVQFRAHKQLDIKQENTTKDKVAKTTKKQKPSIYKVITNYYVTKLNVATSNNNKNGVNDDRKRENKAKEKEDSIAVSRKDLLYYMDDETLIEKKNKNSIEIHNQDTASVKYKVLKKKHKDYRRKGQTEFIQEESKDGFAIVKLGDGPFPALRLSPARRQYMRDHAEVGSEEEEVPPPSISHEATSDAKTPQ